MRKTPPYYLVVYRASLTAEPLYLLDGQWTHHASRSARHGTLEAARAALDEASRTALEQPRRDMRPYREAKIVGAVPT